MRSPMRPVLNPVCRNPFRSILVRAIEIVYACGEALRLITDYEPPPRPFVLPEPRDGVGYACTEAPRGLLYHRYELDPEGTILDARLCRQPRRTRASSKTICGRLPWPIWIATRRRSKRFASRASAITILASPAPPIFCNWSSPGMTEICPACVLVIGIGNPDRGDDGCGAAVMARLQASTPPGSFYARAAAICSPFSMNGKGSTGNSY